MKLLREQFVNIEIFSPLPRQCDLFHCSDKFILSVSIIADIEQCPQTPPPEPVMIRRTFSPLSQYAQQSSSSSQQLVEQESANFIQSDEFRSAVPTEV